jgi:2-methylcitrate dehydratase PrpD
MTTTKKVAEFVARLEYTRIPPSAIDWAKSGLLDSVGVALAGSHEAPGRIAAEHARDESEKNEAALFGHGVRSSSTLAAFANGTASHAMDFDASFVMMGQPMAGLAATVFALAELLHASGKQLLEAYVAGFEVTAKLAWSMPVSWSEGGAFWHATATIGSLGCTAAAARLLHLEPDSVSRALGIASSMASGSVGNFGTMSKPLHAGLAARNGVTAARLAQRGFTGSEHMLEESAGFYATFAPGLPPDLERFDELGRTWDVDGGIRYKAYPCGGLAHTAIDAALALRGEAGIAPEAIEAIDVAATRYAAGRIIYGIPETELQAKFSMPYLVACALIDGKVTPDSFTDEAIREPRVLALAAKVQMHGDDRLDSDSSGRRPSILSVRLRDGRTSERRVDYPKGSAEVRLSRDELEDKFRSCARRVLGEPAVEQALGILNRLESLDDVGRLSTLLMGDADGASA